jgi:hypothetical protein
VLRSSWWPVWLAVAALHLLAIAAIWQALRPAVVAPASPPQAIMLERRAAPAAPIVALARVC